MVAGDAVDADTVQAAAEPGRVWVDETTRGLSSAAITFTDTGEHALKGKSEQQYGDGGGAAGASFGVLLLINHGMGDLQTVSALALNAGLDMDMVSEGFLTTIKKSLQEGKVTQTQIDDACRRILEAKYKLGLFDNPYKYAINKTGERDSYAENGMAAREIAAHNLCC